MLLWISEKKNSAKVKTHILAEGNTHNIFHFENINFKYVLNFKYKLQICFENINFKYVSKI